MKTKKILALLLVSVMIASSFSAISAISDAKEVIFNNPTNHDATIIHYHHNNPVKTISVKAGETFIYGLDDDLASSFSFTTEDGSTKTVNYNNVDDNPDGHQIVNSYGADVNVPVWYVY
jgi:hypothetical protein